MSEMRLFLEQLLVRDGIVLSPAHKNLLDTLSAEEQYIASYQQIKNIQQALMSDLKLRILINEMINSHLVIPNAMVGKPYEARLNIDISQPEKLEIRAWEGLEELGLAFDPAQNLISGIPTQSGDTQLSFLFRIEGEDEALALHQKTISFFINADPRSLWKNIPSDQDALYAKSDELQLSEQLGEKRLVAVSKRGRSHENTGSFREDDVACRQLYANGWSVVAVSDGAGSYPLSRLGSARATEAVINFFGQEENSPYYTTLEEQLQAYNDTPQEALLPAIHVAAKQWMYEATKYVHNRLRDAAADIQTQHPELLDMPKLKNAIEYLHSTLVFTVFKKYAFGYILLSFGVGDCPVAIMDTEGHTTLLNLLDVGEFGGGTRFITQADIFHATEIPMEQRFTVKIVPDFKYLFLMTDGIYDPKFGVEAQLENPKQWQAFVADLEGDNESGTAVHFDQPDEAARQLSDWMNFWSVGNHDDRTLAIIY